MNGLDSRCHQVPLHTTRTAHWLGERGHVGHESAVREGVVLGLARSVATERSAQRVLAEGRLAVPAML